MPDITGQSFRMTTDLFLLATGGRAKTPLAMSHAQRSGWLNAPAASVS